MHKIKNFILRINRSVVDEEYYFLALLVGVVIGLSIGFMSNNVNNINSIFKNGTVQESKSSNRISYVNSENHIHGLVLTVEDIHIT